MRAAVQLTPCQIQLDRPLSLLGLFYGHSSCLFYFFAAISIWLGLVSLRGGVRFVRYLQAESAKEYRGVHALRHCLHALRGVDVGLKENIDAIFAQDYPGVRDRFCDRYGCMIPRCADHRRGATFIQRQVRSRHADSWFPDPRLIAGKRSITCLSGIAVTPIRDSEVFVFVDSDARPEAYWLRSLVAPLQDRIWERRRVIAGSCRSRGGVASHLRSVWNAAIASALGADGRKTFAGAARLPSGGRRFADTK